MKSIVLTTTLMLGIQMVNAQHKTDILIKNPKLQWEVGARLGTYGNLENFKNSQITNAYLGSTGLLPQLFVNVDFGKNKKWNAELNLGYSRFNKTLNMNGFDVNGNIVIGESIVVKYSSWGPELHIRYQVTQSSNKMFTHYTGVNLSSQILNMALTKNEKPFLYFFRIELCREIQN